jgi:hypothetical protein
MAVQPSKLMARGLVRFGWALMILSLIWALTPLPVKAQEQSGITSPSPGSSLSGDVPIFGTAVIEPFQKYELHYKQEPSGDDAYIYFGGGTTPVVNGQLGVWQAGGLPPGTYSLRLRVVKADGNYAEYYTPNLSLGGEGPTPTPTEGSPTETPTPSPTVTPVTPVPQPTAAVGSVQQPQVEGEVAAVVPTPTPIAVAAVDPGVTPTPEPLFGDTTGSTGTTAGTVSEASAESGLTRELGEALAFSTLRERFWSGVRYSAALCIAALALFGGKRIFDWVWTQFR